MLLENLEEVLEWAVRAFVFRGEDRLQPVEKSDRPDEDLKEPEDLFLGLGPPSFDIPLVLIPIDSPEVSLDRVCHVFGSRYQTCNERYYKRRAE